MIEKEKEKKDLINFLHFGGDQTQNTVLDSQELQHQITTNKVLKNRRLHLVYFHAKRK